MPKLTPQELLARDMSEAELQSAIIELAHALGWTVRHVRDSRGLNFNDMPDLLLIRSPRMEWWENKSQRGRLTPGQEAMHDLLRACGQVVRVVRPSDWIQDRILDWLR